MLDGVVAHGVVKGDFVACGDWSPSDEVVGMLGVESYSAIWIARVVDLGSQATVPGPLSGSDLGGMRIVLRQEPYQKSDHHRVARLEVGGRDYSFSGMKVSGTKADLFRDCTVNGGEPVDAPELRGIDVWAR